MNIWTKILVFFPLWLIFSGIFYGMVFLIYPDSFSGSKAEFDALFSNNYGFLFCSQVAGFLGIFSVIFFVYKVIDKQKLTFLNSMFKPEGLLVGAGIGAIMIFMIILILSLTTKVSITYNGFNISILYYVVIFFIVAISEEAMARGFIFSNLFNQSNKYLAFFISALLFSLMHVLNASFSWTGMVNIILIGILFCQLYISRMNLSIPIGLHFSWNLLQGPIMGFSVSGLGTESILKIKDYSGSKFPFEDFGLEGSIITTLVIGFFIVYFYVSHTRKILKSAKLETSSINIDSLKLEARV